MWPYFKRQKDPCLSGAFDLLEDIGTQSEFTVLEQQITMEMIILKTNTVHLREHKIEKEWVERGWFLERICQTRISSVFNLESTLKKCKSIFSVLSYFLIVTEVTKWKVRMINDTCYCFQR